MCYFSGAWKESLRKWEKKLNKAARMNMEKEPALKTFVPANKNLPLLKEYAQTLKDEYWEKWETNPYREEKGSFIKHQEVRKVAEEMNFREKEKVEMVATMLENGASLGVEGEGRWSSWEPNNPSVYEYGSRVADALQTGIREGIIYGPMKKEDLPWDPKVSPMTVRLKPNGSARIIMDLSAPHGPTLGEGEACSPNMGMENYEEFEEVVMAGERKWRKCMHQAGRPCSMFKADWDMAYKHVAVRCEDHYLQVIEFGGRFFV